MTGRSHSGTGAGWRHSIPPSWPRWAADWAGTRGSLTARLVSLGKGFEVEPIWQGRLRLNAAEARYVGIPVGRQVDVRLVKLKVGGRVVVVAKTIKLLSPPRCDWPFWRGLGSRSLGSALFKDARVKRGKLQFGKLPKFVDWPSELAGCNTMGLARQAKFSRGQGATPLWVCEVFLPALGALAGDWDLQ